MSFAPEEGRALAPFTTLGLGGPARLFAEVTTRAQLIEALDWARAHGERVAILGGGSNLVVADAGFDGLVLRMATRGIEITPNGELTVEAGEPWDDVVACAVEENLTGLECLTGIPGSAGATPIQNVGAYGQEVSDTLVEVEVLERATGTVSWLSARECAFGYRDSRFKHEPERFIVLSARFRLVRGAAPSLRYGELSRALAGQSAPSLREVAQTVRALRASKSMVLDANDVNTRSAGSFFMNPIVRDAEAERVRKLALERGLGELPSFAATPGFTKLAAGWLIERAGIQKGMRRGAVGISSKHALALVHHGGGTTRELLALADEVRSAVADAFGVELHMEPVRWG